MSRDFAITPETIAQTAGEDSLNTLLNIHITIIENRIRDAVSTQKSEIRYDLPGIFTEIKALSTKDCQRILYGRLLEKLDAAGYKTVIYFTDKTHFLIIKWPSILDSDLHKEMDNLILDHMDIKKRKHKRDR